MEKKKTGSLKFQSKIKRKSNKKCTEIKLGPREERQNCLLGDPSDSFSVFVNQTMKNGRH